MPVSKSSINICFILHLMASLSGWTEVEPKLKDHYHTLRTTHNFVEAPPLFGFHLCFFPSQIVCISASFPSQSSRSEILHFKHAVLIMPVSASLRHLDIFDVLHTDGKHAFFSLPPQVFNNLVDFQLLFQDANESSARMCAWGIEMGIDEDNLESDCR